MVKLDMGPRSKGSNARRDSSESFEVSVRITAKLARESLTKPVHVTRTCHREPEATFATFDEPGDLFFARRTVCMALLIREGCRHESIGKSRSMIEGDGFEQR